MSLKQLSLLLIILQIQGSSSSSIIPEDIDCSKIEALLDSLQYLDFPIPTCSKLCPSDSSPSLLFTSVNSRDEALFNKNSKVRRICSETRTFTIRCLALYPISLTSDYILNDYDDEQLKMNTKSEFYPDMGLFVINTYTVISSQEEFHLEATCMPTCNPKNFPSGIEILTEQESHNLSKIVIQNTPGSKEQAKGRWFSFLSDWFWLGWGV